MTTRAYDKKCIALAQLETALLLFQDDVRPEPEIQWADLPSRAISVAGTRRMLQESLRIILELDGLIAAVLGPRYRRWRLIRQLEKLQAEVVRAS